VKERFRLRMGLERDKIAEENNRLLEESGDIDYQVGLFKAELLSGQLDRAQADIESDRKTQVEAARAEGARRVEREKERMQAETDARVDKEREKEGRKDRAERGKVEVAKDEAARVWA